MLDKKRWRALGRFEFILDSKDILSYSASYLSREPSTTTKPAPAIGELNKVEEGVELNLFVD